MSKIKICGITRIEDIEAVNEYMPDYIGFVFAKSKRQIDKVTAQRLKDKLNPSILTVGVFVNELISNIVSLWEEKVIDVIQLHGEENEDYMIELRKALNRKKTFRMDKEISECMIKAVRVKEKICFDPLDLDVQQSVEPEDEGKDKSITEGLNEISADYLLFDTYHHSQYGGSGETFSWDVVASAQNSIIKPFFLAGGINLQNIEEAVHKVHPYCIDISSGAETNGLKDSVKIKELVEKIRSI